MGMKKCPSNYLLLMLWCILYTSIILLEYLLKYLKVYLPSYKYNVVKYNIAFTINFWFYSCIMDDYDCKCL